MSRTRISGYEGLRALAGQPVGQSDWKDLDFSRIQTFAEATGDHQWIHVDRERIGRESPFGAPVAHGYLTLSLVAGLFFEVLELDGFKMVINYGCNKVRFPNPLKEGNRFRLSLRIGEVKDVGEWVEVTFHASIDIEGQAKPACAAECIYRFLAA